MNYADFSWCERHGARHTKGKPCPQCVREDADGTTERLSLAEANLANQVCKDCGCCCATRVEAAEKAIARAEAAEAAAGQMRAALVSAQYRGERSHNSALIKAALATDAGKGWVSPEAHAAVVRERDEREEWWQGVSVEQAQRLATADARMAEAIAARTTALEQTGKFAALAAELRKQVDLAEAHAGRMANALKQCRNLTRMQEQSPGTVREVGERVAEIVTSAIVAPAAEVALKERVEINAELRRVVDLMAEQRAQLTEAKSKAHDLANEVQGLRGRLAHVAEAIEGWKP